MTDADKLAQLLAEHRFRIVEFDGAVCSCGTIVTASVNSTTIKAAWPKHQAAVVLAHLAAEGWAQGREEWGLQYERQADPTMDNPSGVVTNTMTLRDESHARGVLDSPAPISARNKRVVRRHVTEWETI